MPYLALAAIEDADTATRNLQIKVVAAQVATSVGYLNDHLLALNSARGEGQFVARAAPAFLGFAGDASSSKAVREVVVHFPGLVVVAHVAGTTVAPTLCKWQ